jgi:hypothetical protein
MAQTNANLIWKIADLLPGPYQPNQYGDVILPFTILRRLDCVVAPSVQLLCWIRRGPSYRCWGHCQEARRRSVRSLG